MPKKYRLTIKALRERPPWEIAKAMGIEYIGDMNPVPHGGTFYSLANWKHDYADCVHFSESEGKLWVEHSHVGKDLRKLPAAFKSWGWELGDDGTVSHDGQHWQEVTPQMEFEAMLSYCGIDIPSLRSTFKSDNGKDWGTFPEFRIFKAAKPLIESLVDQ